MQYLPSIRDPKSRNLLSDNGTVPGSGGPQVHRSPNPRRASVSQAVVVRGVLTVLSQGSVPLDPLYTLGGGAAVGAATLFENKRQSRSYDLASATNLARG